MFQHGSPKPLKVATDLAKRLLTDLNRGLTPDQRRDFSRLLKLIEEAERNHIIDVTRLMHQKNAAPHDPTQPPKRRFSWA